MPPKRRLPAVADCIVTTMCKKNDRTYPRNYRPITLLNGDYKILMRVLAIRINEAVRQFASPEQNGFTPDSFLPENIMLMKLIQATWSTKMRRRPDGGHTRNWL